MSGTLALHGPEVRTFAALSLREVDSTAGGRFIEGLAVPYDVWENVGWFAERHVLGEFTATITAHPNLPLLLFHDSRSFPVGVADEWRDGTEGLGCVWRMDGSEEARRAAQLARDGMLTGLSIGFVPIRSDWKFCDDDEWDPAGGIEHMDRVTRLESRLLEVSLTPTPAFAGAQVQLVRSRGAGDGKREGHGRERPAHRPRVEEARAWLASRRPAC